MMRTRAFFCVLLIGSVAACSSSPTAPETSRPPATPAFDADSTGAVTPPPGQHGSGTGG